MTSTLWRANTPNLMQPSTPRTSAPPPSGTGCHYRPAVGPPGCSNTPLMARSAYTLQALRGPGANAGPAAAGSNNMVLERDVDLAPPMAALGQAQLQSWLNVQTLDTFQEDWPLRDSKAHLCLVGTSIKVKDRRHAVICIVLRERGSVSNRSHAAGSSLAGSVLHWGCTRQERDKWMPPPPGWHTVPDASHDAGGGAWQTPFEEHALGEGGEKVQVMMLHIPLEGVLSTGGIASIVKASGNRWLGNGRTRHDFYFDLQRLPTTSNLPAIAEGGAAAQVSSNREKAQSAVAEVLSQMGAQTLQPLDMESLGKAPPAPPSQQHAAKQHAQEPELPNAGRRPPEPRNDETQVCTMSAVELRSEAEAQLRAWAAPDSQEALSVTLHEFPVKGHTAPFVVAAAAITSTAGEPQLVLCGVADQGFTGRKVAGLMLQWSCAADAQSGPVQDLPPGWATEPSYSWDAGDGFWATPFHQNASDANAKELRTYSINMCMPLVGTFRSAGLLFELKTARGQWLINNTTNGPFFLGFKPLAEALLGPLTPEASDLPPVGMAEPATPTTPIDQPAESAAAKHAAEQSDAPASTSSGAADSAAAESQAAAPDPSSSREGAGSMQKRVSGRQQAHVSAGSSGSATGGLASAGDLSSTITRTPAVPVCDWMVRRLAEVEPQAERSLMHRFKLGAELLASAEASDSAGAALAALAVWLRYSAGRQLTWNKNYNIKPREISAAQSALASALAAVADRAPARRQLALLAMTAVGRGGQGDVGQRIRDEILTVQQRNKCKGGMMEEWHQKLHNNTSPDDVIICEALLAYIRSGLQISAYWDTLAASGIDAARLASYDRPVRSEPKFSKEQCEGLDRDLTHYLATLRAVHCGDDLRSAADTVLGYKQHEVKGKVIEVPAVQQVASPELRKLVQRLLQLQQPGQQTTDTQQDGQLDANAAKSAGGEPRQDAQQRAPTEEAEGEDELEEVVPADPAAAALLSMQLASEARQLLQPHIAATNSNCGDRLKDVLFLDLALDLAARTALQSSLEALRASAADAPLSSLLQPVLLALQHVCLSGPPPFGGNGEELVLCFRQLERLAAHNTNGPERHAAMEAQSVWDRLSRALGDAAESCVEGIQPVAEAAAAALGIQGPPVSLFAEEVVRGTTGAALAQLLSAFQPRLRELSGAGPWQIISRQPSSVTGQLLRIPSLAGVQRSTYEQPTILVTDTMGGDEDLPTGAVALVVVGSCPDVLCHAAVRARNAQVPFVACMDAGIADELRAMDGTYAQLSISAGEDVSISSADAAQAAGHEPLASDRGSSNAGGAASSSQQTLLREPAPWCGRWVIPASDFVEGVVGAKALNTQALSGRLPGWVRQPWSLALPQGVFEEVLRAPGNEDVRQQLQQQLGNSRAGTAAPDAATLHSIRHAIMRLNPPPELEQQLGAAVSTAAPSGPALDFGATWAAAKRVWASQWNDRAALALARAGLPAAHLRMSVLVQGVVAVKYAFVAHTTNPTNGNQQQVYVDIVRGLGEVLVGGWPGRALSAVVEKSSMDLTSSSDEATGAPSSSQLEAVQVVAFPSKSVALVLPADAQAGEDGSSRALMMRSDSNAEDLPGFAGAGLFDSHPTMELQQRLVDYSNEPLVTESAFAKALAWRVAAACCHVESLLGCAQDVEGGVCADGSIVILQARPQV